MMTRLRPPTAAVVLWLVASAAQAGTMALLPGRVALDGPKSSQRVLVEARAFGCTVVGSMVGGIPTSIEDGVDGLLFPPENPDALCAALLRIASDETLRKRLVANGIERARRCTVEAFAGMILEEAVRLQREFGSSAGSNRSPVLMDSPR